MQRYQIRLGQRVLHTSSTPKRALDWLKRFAPLGASIYVIWIH